MERRKERINKSSNNREMKKEDWVNQLMSSLDGYQEVNPTKDLLDGILARVYQNNTIIPFRALIGIAASFLLLVFLNIQAIQSQSVSNNVMEEQQLLQELGMNESNQIYY